MEARLPRCLLSADGARPTLSIREICWGHDNLTNNFQRRDKVGLQCDMCQRNVALWNFKAITYPFDHTPAVHASEPSPAAPEASTDEDDRRRKNSTSKQHESDRDDAVMHLTGTPLVPAVGGSVLRVFAVAAPLSVPPSTPRFGPSASSKSFSNPYGFNFAANRPAAAQKVSSSH